MELLENSRFSASGVVTAHFHFVKNEFGKMVCCHLLMTPSGDLLFWRTSTPIRERGRFTLTGSISDQRLLPNGQRLFEVTRCKASSDTPKPAC